MPAALATPCRIKRNHRRRRRIASGRTVYAYVDANPVNYVDPLGLSKGGKRNISVGDFNKRSNPNDVERALEEAKRKGASQEHINALRGLLKVIKRGGKMADGLLPGLLFENLMEQECEQGDQMACSIWCKLNPEQCEEIADDYYESLQSKTSCPAEIRR